MTRRHSSVIAILTAALFLLQGPLCAFACSSSGSDPTLAFESSETTSAAQADVPPCHQSESAPGSPAPTGSSDDCGCEEAAAAVPSTPDLAASDTESPAFQPTAPVSGQLDVETREGVFAQSVESHLPPPDILLLHSTCLI